MTHTRQFIVPPYLLRNLAASAEPAVAQTARRTLLADNTFRADRGGLRPVTARPAAIS